MAKRPAYEELAQRVKRLESEIATQKQFQKDLTESARTYSALIENAPDIIYILDSKGNFKFLGGTFEKTLGFTAEELTGKHFTSIIHPEDVEKAQWRFNERRTGARSTRGLEVRLNVKEGTEKHFDIKYMPIELYAFGLYDQSNSEKKESFFGTYGVVREITERKQTEEMLRNSEQHYRTLSDATFEAVFISEKGVCLEANHRAIEMFGYDHDELIGIFGTGVIATESKDLVRRHMLSGYEKPYEVIAQKKDGTTFYAEICGKMMKYEGRDFRVTVVHDIDKRKRAEIALQKSEKRFRHLIEGSIQGVLIHRKLKPVFVNQAYADIFGYTIKEMLAMDTALSPFAPFEQGRLVEYMNTRLQGEEAPTHYECQGIKKDGSPIWLENRVTRAEGWGKDTLQVTIFDITDRKRVADALEKRSHQLRERVKELHCLYGISGILETSEFLNMELFQSIVNLIAPASRYPEMVCARITINDYEWRTKNFKETPWKLVSDIALRGQRVGSLTVCYLEEKPDENKGPFVKEEINLVNVVAEQLGKIVERIRVEEALRESEEKLRYLSSSLMKAQEKERQRISFGLHDQLGQDLSALKIQLNSIENGLQEDQKRLKEACESTRQYVDQIVENVRRISRGLSPTILQDIGLTATLRWMIKNFTEQTQIKVSLDMADIDGLFSEETQVIIFRIFQEAFTNIRKHSRATHVSVEIIKKKSGVSFMVNDNGRGFDMQEVEARNWPEKGLGLTTMEERTRILGGPFERFSRKGEGTRITLAVPFNGKRSGQ